MVFFFFSSRRRHTRSLRDWSSDVCSSDLPDDGDLDFNGAVADPAVVEEAFAAWKAQIAAADEWLDGQIDLDAVVLTPRGEQVGIRHILIHMIEEYARHCGHADLLRERIDGRTGQ